MSLRETKDIQQRYNLLLKRIRKLGASGTRLEDVILNIIRGVLYSRGTPEIPDMFKYHHHALILIKLIVLHYPRKVRSIPNYRNAYCSEFINQLIELSDSIHDLRMTPQPRNQSKKYWLEIFRPWSFQQFYLQQFFFGHYQSDQELDRQDTIFTLRDTLKYSFNDLSAHIPQVSSHP